MYSDSRHVSVTENGNNSFSPRYAIWTKILMASHIYGRTVIPAGREIVS